MATIEERMQTLEREHKTLEQEHTELKKTIELQTIAIGALVNKAALEKLNEKHDKLFQNLITHDQFIDTQLAELREQQTELDGKVVGLQAEMRQRFTQVETTQQDHTTRLNRMENRLDRIEGMLTKVLDRLPEKP